MLLSSYSPDSQGHCPTCDKTVRCLLSAGNLAFHPRYVELSHPECGTVWRRYVDLDYTEIMESKQ